MLSYVRGIRTEFAFECLPLVRLELLLGIHLGGLPVSPESQTPDITPSLAVNGGHVGALLVDVDRQYHGVTFGNLIYRLNETQLTFEYSYELLVVVGFEVPQVDDAALVADQQLHLVGVQADAGDGRRGLEDLGGLRGFGPVVPDPRAAVLASRVHPLAFLLEADPGYVLRDALVVHHRVRVVGIEVVHANVLVTCCC